ncbi:iron uptake porin [Acaryochloris marina]|uniref:Porin major outer membrane protein n=1 Tax=Acaryochloris marina (strain MBIC 11017) TaxID=329726 RepID=B0C9R2_ACAM1|nr:iron uptake porin [Acaryochloris marina]ABW30210.1 porin; major outer membrane protein [Acaryochloris marina MBIC11017]BDM79049.1 porin [Acaryochloris marina MBIC10699]
MQKNIHKKVYARTFFLGLAIAAGELSVNATPITSLNSGQQNSPIVAESGNFPKSKFFQPIQIANAEELTINELLGSGSNKTYQGDRSLHDLEDNSQAQVTAVGQLSDVDPTDWAFQAIQSLVERYGCVAGYPNGTFRPSRAISRREAAALVNACLDNLSNRFATKEDLDALKALQDEFAAELATLRGRVDGLEARVATVEAQQFSTTTKLQGEVVMAAQFGDFVSNAQNTFPVPRAIPNGNAPGLVATNSLNPLQPTNLTTISDSRPSAIARVRLNFNTSFYGDDLLQTQFEFGNGGLDFFSAAGLNSPVSNGIGGPLGNPGPFVGGDPNPFPVPRVVGGTSPGNNLGVSLVDLGAVDYAGLRNGVVLRRLAYSFKPIGQDVTLTVGTNMFPSDFIDSNSYANNSAQDFNSGFFINNPLIIANSTGFSAGNWVPGGAGAAVDWNVNGGPVSFRALYIARDGKIAGRNPGSALCDPAFPCTGGLFGDPYQASAELEYADTWGEEAQNNFAVRLQYTHSETNNVRQNALGANVEATFNRRFGIFGRIGYSIDPQIVVNTVTGQRGDLFNPDPNNAFGTGIGNTGISNYILTWMGGLGIRDLGAPGSLLAVAIGQPFVVAGDGQPSQTNFEAFYRFSINDNITLTPTVMFISNPFNLSGNNDVIQGLLRATFSF